MGAVRLTKHHGLGNDFLVLLDPDGAASVAAEEVRALCDRRRGVGADGLLRLGPDERMTLWNADGGVAEMSGNGIRCLAQAVARDRGLDALDLTVQTDVGPRRVEVTEGRGPTCAVRVDMGAATIRRSETRVGAEVDTGNPHLVLLVDDLAGVDLLALGTRHPEVNVEVIAPGPGTDELRLRVHERGAGVTEACGTGSVAAAVVAHAWGLVGPVVTVHNPGGDVTVEVKHETTLLTGPATFVAAVEVPWPPEAPAPVGRR